MGRYIAPPNNEYETKCAIIFYPDDSGAFFLDALKGQLSALAFKSMWETDDKQLLDDIQQAWIEHDLMTDDVFFRLPCELIDVIVGDEALEINVNLDCNCSGGASGVGGEITLVCGEGGDTTVCIPPDEPGDEYVDIIDDPDGDLFDPNGPLPPVVDDLPDVDTWSDYDIRACEVANFIVRELVRECRYFAYAEETFRTIGGIADFIRITGSTALLAKGLDWMLELSKLMISYLANRPLGANIFAVVADGIENDETFREDIVCSLFENRYQISFARGAMHTVIASWLTANGYTDTHATRFRDTIAWLWDISRTFEIFTRVSLPIKHGESDCSGCAGGSPPTLDEITIDFTNKIGAWSFVLGQGDIANEGGEDVLRIWNTQNNGGAEITVAEIVALLEPPQDADILSVSFDLKGKSPSDDRIRFYVNGELVHDSTTVPDTFQTYSFEAGVDFIEFSTETASNPMLQITTEREGDLPGHTALIDNIVIGYSTI